MAAVQRTRAVHRAHESGRVEPGIKRTDIEQAWALVRPPIPLVRKIVRANKEGCWESHARSAALAVRRFAWRYCPRLEEANGNNKPDASYGCALAGGRGAHPRSDHQGARTGRH